MHRAARNSANEEKIKKVITQLSMVRKHVLGLGAAADHLLMDSLDLCIHYKNNFISTGQI